MSFPTVATVIGISQEVAKSGPLLATLAIDPSIIATQASPLESIEIRTNDPVTQAVVDNIIGKLPTKKQPVMLKCEICNITVSSREILQTHYAGVKHARKVKGQELIKEIANSPNSTFVASSAQNGCVTKTTEFTCKICSVRVNSYQQLQQHLTGSKHKNKAETNKSNTMQMSVPNGDSGMVNVDIGPNRLYCAACDVHVNSDLQLHQHITSNKHANKVNGRGIPANNNRGTPYSRQTNREGGGNWSNSSWADSFIKNKYSNSRWNTSSTGLDLVSNIPSNWTQHTVSSQKSFVSGGLLYN